MPRTRHTPQAADDIAWAEKPWTRHPKESDAAWAVFAVWVNEALAPSLSALARSHGLRPDTVHGWSSRAGQMSCPMRWADRRAAMQRHQTKLGERARDALAVKAVKVRRKAHTDLLAAVPAAVARLASFVDGTTKAKATAAQLKAIQEILDRAGIGALNIDTMARDATTRAAQQTPPALALDSLPKDLRGVFLRLVAVATGQRAWCNDDAEALCYAVDSVDPGPLAITADEETT